jgi:hypothetical protein
MHYTDPDYDTYDDLMEAFLSGFIIHVFDYEDGAIDPGPDVCEVHGPRPPRTPTWVAFVQYDENNVIKGVD